MIRIDCRGVSTSAPEEARQLREAVDCFGKHGYAILDHAFSPEAIRQLHAELGTRLSAECVTFAPKASLEVGAQRFMIPVPLAGGFANPLIFANPFVVALTREILGDDAILDSFGAIVSLPGADEQVPHRDGPDLFDAQISALLPAHALTLGLPLVEMNDTNGTTAIWPGSHRAREHDAGTFSERPTIPPGSCLLWDFRLYHAGTANRSAEARPLIYATYARCWYQDPVNFSGKPLARLAFDPDLLPALPPAARALLRLAANAGSR
jgi:hypothetical protein